MIIKLHKKLNRRQKKMLAQAKLKISDHPKIFLINLKIPMVKQETKLFLLYSQHVS